MRRPGGRELIWIQLQLASPRGAKRKQNGDQVGNLLESEHSALT